MVKNINLAYYKQEDWNRFLALIDDRENMHDTWKEWNKAYQKMKKNLVKDGFQVNDYIVDLDELRDYCYLQGIRIDGKARSQFVSGR